MGSLVGGDRSYNLLKRPRSRSPKQTPPHPSLRLAEIHITHITVHHVPKTIRLFCITYLPFLLINCSKSKRLYWGYRMGFLYMQILHYNNDFEIDKMCLRNWCALENSYTFAFLPKSNLEIETHTQTLFSIVTHFPPLFHN